MQNNFAKRDAPQTACRMGQTTDALSRFLSNDLRAGEAESVRAHLQTCAACQADYAQMRLIQAGLRALPDPAAPYGGADAARDRVFARLERSVRVGETTPSPANSRRAAVKPPWFVMTGLASAAAACAVLGLIFWPAAPQSIPVPAPTSGATPAALLPSPNEMAFLYQLHDTQHGETASGSLADPADRRDSAAEARANLLKNAEPLVDNEAF